LVMDVTIGYFRFVDKIWSISFTVIYTVYPKINWIIRIITRTISICCAVIYICQWTVQLFCLQVYPGLVHHHLCLIQLWLAVKKQ
jgi:hypothetical protein